MRDSGVLIIDGDPDVGRSLATAFGDSGLSAESVSETFAAIDKLRDVRYRAVILDPMIRDRLNGYAVLNFIELDQPETLDHLFLWTAMSEQTIRRTAPAALPRFFRKPSAATDFATTVIEACGLMNRGGRSVLVVEDDQATARATMEVLRQLGYTTAWARDGGAALEALAAREFDAIMLDLVMPGIDGFTVLDHVHLHDPALLRRVIVITGMPDKYVSALERSALCGVIRKPVDVATLKPLLAECTN